MYHSALFPSNDDAVVDKNIKPEPEEFKLVADPVAGFPDPLIEERSIVCLVVPFIMRFKEPVSALPKAPDANAKYPFAELGPTSWFKVPVIS